VRAWAVYRTGDTDMLCRDKAGRQVRVQVHLMRRLRDAARGRAVLGEVLVLAVGLASKML
jgi:hypothetical protein